MTLAKAKLVEIKSFSTQSSQVEKADKGKEVEVQFNPQSLKLSYSNKNTGGKQPGGSAKQFVGSGSSQLSVELLFDTTEDGGDVRNKTKDIAYFVMATPQSDQDNKRVPPRVRFQWGSFIFEGVVESMNETLEYFSEEGVPMRASVSLNLSRDDIVFLIKNLNQASSQASSSGEGTGATKPLQPASTGDSLQQLAGRLGKSSTWKAIAAANGIDDPLRLQAGALIDLNIKLGK